MFPRDVLNRIRWTGNPDLSGVKLRVLHRGAPDDGKIINGEEIIGLEHSFMVMEDQGNETRIPYHRVQRILVDDEKVYDRSDYRDSGKD